MDGWDMCEQDITLKHLTQNVEEYILPELIKIKLAVVELPNLTRMECNRMGQYQANDVNKVTIKIRGSHGTADEESSLQEYDIVQTKLL
jgi:hypothetical protein